ncbi:MAG: hypothetical protein P1V97_29780, partial [Planctomycetota bacterium]|nr:hypothetical protein [Planctomycetota bacterium]
MATLDDKVKAVYKQCIDLANQLQSQARVLEALWDGDSQGWCLELFLTTVDNSGSEKRSHFESLNYGSDLRLFNGQVPPWPESIVAQGLGARLSQEFNCVIWFPSPEHPDDDCPAYSERHLAIPCADCCKLIMPIESPDIPKDLCYSCQDSRREKERRLKEPGNSADCRGIYFSLEQHDNAVGFESFYCSATEDTAKILAELLKKAGESADWSIDTRLGPLLLTKLNTLARDELKLTLGSSE